MILSVGARTDIVNHYGDWLMERFREGFVYQRNPMFPDKVTRYALSPEQIDAIYFCSKNYAPFLDRAALFAKQYRTLFHYTITAYGKDLEPNIPSVEESIDTLLRLASLVGREKVVWRYDPVLLTAIYTEDAHREAFERIALALSGKIGRCIFGFAEVRPDMRKTIPDFVLLTPPMKERLAAAFAKTAERYRFALQICRGSASYEKFGIDAGGCVRLDLLGTANGCAFRDMKHRGNRRWCRCIESRDVGFYESCPNLCKYCFANTDADAVQKNIALHDDASPLLIGNLRETDIVLQGVQTSYLKNSADQLSFFD